MHGASFRAGLGWRSILVVTLPDYATGGAYVVKRDGVIVRSGNLAPNAALLLLEADSSRRDQAIVSTGTADAEYGFHPGLKPGEGWVCQANGGGYAESFAHIGPVYAVSVGGTTLRVMVG